MTPLEPAEVPTARSEQSVPERLLTMRDACEFLGGVHRMTVRRWVAKHHLPAIRTPSGRLRFPERALVEWARRSFKVLNRP